MKINFLEQEINRFVCHMNADLCLNNGLGHFILIIIFDAGTERKISYIIDIRSVFI